MTINIQDYITVSPEILGGQPVFKDTRVTIESLFDHLAREYTVEEFIYEFDSVTPLQALMVLKIAAELVNAYAIQK
jgi:uncharacterized protein (DUF433 family)